jgi:P-type E1-E2 ATPase
MERFNVDLEKNNFRANMQALESLGRTVVCLAVN